MNKFGIVLGVAAIATLAGCKDPNYAGRRRTLPQDEVKPVAEEKVEQPIEIPAEPAVQPEPQPAPQPELQPTVKPAEPVEETTEYIVQSADYLAKISKKFNVKLEAIRRLNPQIKGDTIRVGQKIRLPGKIDLSAVKQEMPKPAVKPAAAPAAKKEYKPYDGPTKEYVVKSGDFLGKVAAANKITVRQLKELNGLKSDKLSIGQKLKVPGEQVAQVPAQKEKDVVVQDTQVLPPEQPAPVESPVSPAANESPKGVSVGGQVAPVSSAESVPDTTPVPTPAPVVETVEPAATLTHVVQEGEDITAIAIQYDIMQSQIRELNGLTLDDELQPGQVIKLPPDAVVRQ